MHLFTIDSPAHETQTYQSRKFLTTFDDLLLYSKVKVPSLWKDKEFMKDVSDFHDILNGRNMYQQILAGKPYKQFQDDLRNPKSHLSLLPRTASIRND